MQFSPLTCCTIMLYHQSSVVASINLQSLYFRSSHRRRSSRKDALRNFTKFTGKHLCQSLFFNKVAGLCRSETCNFIKKETLAQVFSCEFCEISKNTFFTEPLWATASVTYNYEEKSTTKTENTGEEISSLSAKKNIHNFYFIRSPKLLGKARSMNMS